VVLDEVCATFAEGSDTADIRMARDLMLQSRP